MKDLSVTRMVTQDCQATNRVLYAMYRLILLVGIFWRFVRVEDGIRRGVESSFLWELGLGLEQHLLVG